ncbi:hypothetical protein BSKO_11115 [Bryopsis sp. KO-2023]|nr:hypothetical protein BSKO_11115 [Bryopsis sp. KO-2023]
MVVPSCPRSTFSVSPVSITPLRSLHQAKKARAFPRPSLLPGGRTCRHVCRLAGLEEIPHSLTLASSVVNDLSLLDVFPANPAFFAWSIPFTLASIYPVAAVADVDIQIGYLLILIFLLFGAAFLVVRQALIRRELDESAKSLGETIRTGQGTSEDYFELAAVLIRKKLFTQAIKNLEKAIAVWDADESELAQVYNALGFCLFSTDKVKESIEEYKKAVEFQPGYVTAWNNLGDAYEAVREFRAAYNCYKETLSYDPDNTIAKQRADYLKVRMERLQI